MQEELKTSNTLTKTGQIPNEAKMVEGQMT